MMRMRVGSVRVCGSMLRLNRSLSGSGRAVECLWRVAVACVLGCGLSGNNESIQSRVGARLPVAHHSCPARDRNAAHNPKPS
eukprot:5810996-Prymnesium_polylepis.1